MNHESIEYRTEHHLCGNKNRLTAFIIAVRVILHDDESIVKTVSAVPSDAKTQQISESSNSRALMSWLPETKAMDDINSFHIERLHCEQFQIVGIRLS